MPALTGQPAPMRDYNSEKARLTIKQKSLAQLIRDNWSPEDIFKWFRSVMAGVDPDGSLEKGFQPIDWSIRMRAAKMLVERAHGAVPQHLILEAELNSQVSIAASVATPEAWSRLPEEELQMLRRSMRALLNATTPQTTQTQPIIDAESVEKKEI